MVNSVNDGLSSLRDAKQGKPLTEDTLWRSWPDLDEYYRMYAKQLTVVTGYAGSGKSTFIFNMLMRMAVEGGHKFAMWIPENELQVRNILQRMWQWSPEGFETFAREQCFIQSSMEEHYEEEPQDIVAVLKKIEPYIEKHGIDTVFIDPYNELEAARSRDELTTDYIGKCLRWVKHFARQLDVSAIMVAHPTKASLQEGKPPGPASMEGSMHWWNKGDNCLTVHRPDPQKNVTQVISTKVRYMNIAGRIGFCEFFVDPQTGVFTPITRGIDGQPKWPIGWFANGCATSMCRRDNSRNSGDTGRPAARAVG
jgi:twinkle protein